MTAGGGKGPKRLGDVLSSLMQRRGYARPMARMALVEAWQRAAGERLASRSRVAHFRGGILTIEVSSAAQRYELEAFRGPQLLARIQADPAIAPVTRLIFRVGNIST